MTEIELGAIERLDARDIWKSEPYDFTPWLRENIQLLGEALGLDIDVDVQQEVAVGLFSADLTGTDVATKAGILVENQLEQTDHSHLGQLLTYAGGLGTDILVWVSTKVREEHRQALTWLNERTSEDVLVFGVEIELFRIGESKPAPHFNVVVAPNEWQKTRGGGRAAAVGRSTASPRKELQKAFWRQLLEELVARDSAATTASPDRVPAQNWYGISVGRTGFQDNFVLGWDYDARDWALRVELYIDVGDQAQNKAIFDLLEEDREAIETEFGEPLMWTRRDDTRMSRIFVSRPGKVDDPPGLLAEYQAWGADRMLKIRTVFGPRVKALNLTLPTALDDIDAPEPPPSS